MVMGIGSNSFLPIIGARPVSHLNDSAPELFAQKLEDAQAQSESAQSAHENDALKEAAMDIEAHFLKEILASMRKTIPSGGLFEKSFAKETYEAMLDEHLAQEMARAGGIGLGELLVRQLRGDGR